jgi:hypothetical protein
MNGDVTVRTKEGVTVRIPYTTIKKVKIPTKPEESTEQVTEKQNKLNTKEKEVSKARPLKKN